MGEEAVPEPVGPFWGSRFLGPASGCVNVCAGIGEKGRKE